MTLSKKSTTSGKNNSLTIAQQPPDLCIALDLDSSEKAYALANAIVSGVQQELGQNYSKRIVFKVGLELFIGEGPKVIEKIHSTGSRIFLDLKLHDIPETVRKAVSQVARLPVSFLTLHVQGGKKMVCDAIEETLKSKSPIQLLGVSVLTSFDQKAWQEIQFAYGNKEKIDPSQSAISAIECAAEWGLTGFVCSALDLKKVNEDQNNQKYFQKYFNGTFYWMTPGIRPRGTANDDQARIVTPEDAVKWGSKGLVVGRPITGSINPVKSACEILKAME